MCVERSGEKICCYAVPRNIFFSSKIYETVCGCWSRNNNFRWRWRAQNIRCLLQHVFLCSRFFVIFFFFFFSIVSDKDFFLSSKNIKCSGSRDHCMVKGRKITKSELWEWVNLISFDEWSCSIVDVLPYNFLFSFPLFISAQRV